MPESKGLIPDNWDPKIETYQPSVEEIQEIHDRFISTLFPPLEILNQFPNNKFSLEYNVNGGWPEITIDNKDILGMRQIQANIKGFFAKTVLEYHITTEGEVHPDMILTNCTSQKQFVNNIKGLERSINEAKERKILMSI